MQLFSEKFRDIESDEELESLCNEFPKYDRSYLCQSTKSYNQKTKIWLEELWQKYQPYADSNFLTYFKYEFTQRCWEMYLGSTFLNHGFALGTHSDEGPDFDLRNQNNQRICWVEAIAVEKGDGPDRVPLVRYNTVSTVPTPEITLRISFGLDKKFKKYLIDLEKNIVSEKDPYVIALDRSEVEHMDAQLPNILKAVFGIGDQALRLRVGGEPVENPETFWTHLPMIQKQSGSQISMHFFINPEHAGISAVIYSAHHVINSPRAPKEMGENFCIVHNPLAKNPLPHGVFPFGEEYILEGEYLKRIRPSKIFTKPNPFEGLCD